MATNEPPVIPVDRSRESTPMTATLLNLPPELQKLIFDYVSAITLDW